MSHHRILFRKAAAVVLAACLAFVLTGCGGALQSARSARSANQMRQILIGLMHYLVDNADAWPDRLEQIEEYVGGKEELARLMKNPLTGDDPGYEYVKPADPKAPNTPVLYQLRDGQRELGMPVGYADGSVRPLAR